MDFSGRTQEVHAPGTTAVWEPPFCHEPGEKIVNIKEMTTSSL